MPSVGWGRALLALGLLIQAVAIVLATGLLFVLAMLAGDSPAALGLVLPVALVSPVAAWICFRSGGPPTGFRRAVIWTQLAIQIGFALLCVLLSHELFTDPRTVAPIALERTWPIFIAASSGVLVWGLLRFLWSDGEPDEASRRRTSRQVALIGAGAGTAVLSALSLTAYAADRTSFGCDFHSFDRKGWRAEDAVANLNRKPIAEALIECRDLEGLNRSEVREKLGAAAAGDGRVLRYPVGDSFSLVVSFRDGGRAGDGALVSSDSD